MVLGTTCDPPGVVLGIECGPPGVVLVQHGTLLRVPEYVWSSESGAVWSFPSMWAAPTLLSDPRADMVLLSHHIFTYSLAHLVILLSFFFRSALQKSVSFLNDWSLITTILTGQGNTPVGMWHWNELGNINSDPKRDLGRRPYCFSRCLLRADSL